MTPRTRSTAARRRGLSRNTINVGGEQLAWKLATTLGIEPINDIEKLYGDFWPEDESVDDFIAAMKAWDKEGQ